MSWPWASDWDYSYLTQYHTKQFPSIELLLILFMHPIAPSQKTSSPRRWAQVHFFRELFYFTHMELRSLLSFSILFLAHTESEMDRCSHCSRAAGEGTVFQDSWQMKASAPVHLRGQWRDVFFLCANQQVSYCVKNRQHYSCHHSFSRHIMTEGTKPPSVAKERSQHLTPLQVASLDPKPTQMPNVDGGWTPKPSP